MKSSKMVFVGGAVLAVLGMLLSYMYTGSAKKAAEKASSNGVAATEEAWVAISDISIGTTWEDMSTLVEQRKVPAAVRPLQAITSASQVSAKTLVRNVSKGEVITTVQFNTNGAESLTIPEGQSALTISLPAPQGVGDYIQPGARANIFVTFKGIPNAPKPEDAIMTKMLLSNVKVLANRRALSAQAQAEGTAPASDGGEILLTLAVTIEESERIIFAKENGAVWLTLMRPGDPAGVGLGKTYGTVLL